MANILTSKTCFPQSQSWSEPFYCILLYLWPCSRQVLLVELLADSIGLPQFSISVVLAVHFKYFIPLSFWCLPRRLLNHSLRGRSIMRAPSLWTVILKGTKRHNNSTTACLCSACTHLFLRLGYHILYPHTRFSLFPSASSLAPATQTSCCALLNRVRIKNFYFDWCKVLHINAKCMLMILQNIWGTQNYKKKTIKFQEVPLLSPHRVNLRNCCAKHFWSRTVV